jgi:hypothetical protein
MLDMLVQKEMGVLASCCEQCLALQLLCFHTLLIGMKKAL